MIIIFDDLIGHLEDKRKPDRAKETRSIRLVVARLIRAGRAGSALLPLLYSTVPYLSGRVVGIVDRIR